MVKLVGYEDEDHERWDCMLGQVRECEVHVLLSDPLGVSCVAVSPDYDVLYRCDPEDTSATSL